jgi:hypothetical protein
MGNGTDAGSSLYLYRDIYIEEGSGEVEAPNDESQGLIDDPFGIRNGADLE